MGVYTRLARDFNGHAVYKRVGQDPLYVYFFTSQRDQLSLWVVGPQLGQFIAGIRNSKASKCVHDLVTGWKYAARTGVWEDDDPSLTVRCFNERSDQTNQKDRFTDLLDEVFVNTNQSSPQRKCKCMKGTWNEYNCII